MRESALQRRASMTSWPIEPRRFNADLLARITNLKQETRLPTAAASTMMPCLPARPCGGVSACGGLP